MLGGAHGHSQVVAIHLRERKKSAIEHFCRLRGLGDWLVAATDSFNEKWATFGLSGLTLTLTLQLAAGRVRGMVARSFLLLLDYLDTNMFC